jgi:probable F420-dependent oxidoreductase
VTVSEDVPIRFNLQADLRSRTQWVALAESAETAGFETLYVADHPRSAAAPFVALAAAATVTERIRLGTYVANAGLWDPLLLATELATLDVLSEGRVVFGIGAGHTPAEWTDRDLDYPTASARVDRMIEVAIATRSWLADLGHPRPIQVPIPLLVGGNGRRVLDFAVTHADVVGINGLGATLADGHTHAVAWSNHAVDDRLAPLRGAARPVVIDALVQMVAITDDRETTARHLAAEHDLVAEDLLSCPYALIGTTDQIVDDLVEYRSRWGITRYTVRPSAIDPVLRLRPLLEGR